MEDGPTFWSLARLALNLAGLVSCFYLATHSDEAMAAVLGWWKRWREWNKR